MKSRIEVLDGFRCIAVLSVILYHYFYRFTVLEQFDGYPSWSFVKFGYFGVNLFFMISGFVIYASLDRTNSIKEFLGKRYLRLAPALLLCSVITYMMIMWWNDSARLAIFTVDTPLDFLFSITFIHPDIWNTILGRTNITFIDGTYWSLWPEVIFYISASILFFNSKRERFLQNWFVLVIILYVLRIFTSPRLLAFTPDIIEPFTNTLYSFLIFMNTHQFGYFSAGILFYSLWRNQSPSRLVWIIAAILFMMEMYFLSFGILRILFILSVCLWIVFLKYPRALSFLKWKPIQIIGLISYPLYLLHEAAGFVLAEKILKWTDHSMSVTFVLLIVIIVFVLLSYCVFRFEKPITQKMKEKLLRTE